MGGDDGGFPGLKRRQFACQRFLPDVPWWMRSVCETHFEAPIYLAGDGGRGGGGGGRPGRRAAPRGRPTVRAPAPPPPPPPPPHTPK